MQGCYDTIIMIVMIMNGRKAVVTIQSIRQQHSRTIATVFDSARAHPHHLDHVHAVNSALV